ncbi:MAG: hypothetical protein PWP64_1200 [Candidatus Cloacimonadota bacterium]|nr:hypothetical protein [Candidatus Cloacimonadota bacterium]
MELSAKLGAAPISVQSNEPPHRNGYRKRQEPLSPPARCSADLRIAPRKKPPPLSETASATMPSTSEDYISSLCLISLSN